MYWIDNTKIKNAIINVIKSKNEYMVISGPRLLIDLELENRPWNNPIAILYWFRSEHIKNNNKKSSPQWKEIDIIYV